MRKVISAILLCFTILFFNIHTALAASATINLSPNNGSFGKPFTVKMVVDGHGDKFNAAQATVKLSPNLKITDLTLGDCNFSFLHTPSIQNPSFAGVILSSASSKCTVYTLTLAPVGKGKGTISLSDASVKRFGDAGEILKNTYDGAYSLTGITKAASSVLGSKTEKPPKNGLYTVHLKVVSGSTAITNANVTLSPVSKKNQKKTTTDNTGTAHFTNLAAGVYEVTVVKDSKQLGESVININGPNHILTLGIDIATQKNNPLIKNAQVFINSVSTNPFILAGIGLVGVILGIVIAVLIMKMKYKKQLLKLK